MKKTISILAFFVAGSAFAAGTTTPKETCESLVGAAQQSNYEAFTTLSRMGNMPPAHKGKKEGAAQGFEKMHKDQLDKLKGLTCGAEHIAGTRAFVETTTSGKTRFVPFVKEGEAWKFDTMTYMSFYEAGPMKAKKTK